jgi:hypothetical protein
MKIFGAAIIISAMSFSAFAEDSTPYDEPPDGPISAVGTVLETQDVRCEVISLYSIQCINIGRVCRAYRAEQVANYRKTFGCALESSPNYPCPPWDEQVKKIESNAKAGLLTMCTPLLMGGW